MRVTAVVDMQQVALQSALGEVVDRSAGPFALVQAVVDQPAVAAQDTVGLGGIAAPAGLVRDVAERAVAATNVAADQVGAVA